MVIGDERDNDEGGEDDHGAELEHLGAPRTQTRDGDHDGGDQRDERAQLKAHVLGQDGEDHPGDERNEDSRAAVCDSVAADGEVVDDDMVFSLWFVCDVSSMSHTVPPRRGSVLRSPLRNS